MRTSLRQKIPIYAENFYWFTVILGLHLSFHPLIQSNRINTTVYYYEYVTLSEILNLSDRGSH